MKPHPAVDREGNQMAKRKDLEVGQKWAYVTRRNELHDDAEGMVCTIAPGGWNRLNNVDVFILIHSGIKGEVKEWRKTIQLWQLKELWETFEPKMKQAKIDKHVRFEKRQAALKAQRVHEQEVAEPARRVLANLLMNVTGGYISDWRLGQCLKESQVSELTAFLLKHGVSSDKAAA